MAHTMQQNEWVHFPILFMRAFNVEGNRTEKKNRIQAVAIASSSSTTEAHGQTAQKGIENDNNLIYIPSALKCICVFGYSVQHTLTLGLPDIKNRLNRYVYICNVCTSYVYTHKKKTEVCYSFLFLFNSISLPFCHGTAMNNVAQSIYIYKIPINAIIM